MYGMSGRGLLGHSTKTMACLGGAWALAQRAKAHAANDKDVESAYVCDVAGMADGGGSGSAIVGRNAQCGSDPDTPAKVEAFVRELADAAKE